MLADLTQELMTPDEAARWFRRSPSWLRQQHALLRFGQPPTQPLYHVRVCRAYVFGRLSGYSGESLQQLQLAALANACGLPVEHALRELERLSSELAAENERVATCVETAAAETSTPRG